MNAEQLLFIFFSIGTIVSAASVIFVRNPVASAMSLVASFFFLAGIYVLLWAHTIAVLQILVYAGAIMVVFLFVVMLLNLGHPDELSDLRGKWGRIAGGLLGIALLAQIAALLRTPPQDSLVQNQFQRAESMEGLNAVGAIAKPLFAENLLAFELTSILLLVAIVGAVVLGKRRSHA